jgi:hypothetical protein
MIGLVRWSIGLLLIAAIGLGAVLIFDRAPRVHQDMTLTEAQRIWARGWLAANRPRGLREGEQATLTLSQTEANLLANYLVDLLGEGRAHVSLERGRARLSASLALPWDPQHSFVNIELALVEDAPLPRVEKASLAGLPLPGGLFQSLVGRFVTALDHAGVVEQVRLEADRIQVSYAWREGILEDIGSGLVPRIELDRMLGYQTALAAYIDTRPARRPIELADLLSHLLTVDSAMTPATQSDADPIARNRAVILVLAAYVNGKGLLDRGVTGAPANRPRRHTVLLQGRRDLAQHFMTSAALAAKGGGMLSNLAGLLKEASDAERGSGYSFADLAANRAGIRFAQLATGNPTDARALRMFARRGMSENDFMPPIDGLPEGLAEPNFKADFGDAQSTAYQRMITLIDGRIDARPLFRERPS